MKIWVEKNEKETFRVEAHFSELVNSCYQNRPLQSGGRVVRRRDTGSIKLRMSNIEQEERGTIFFYI